MRRTAFLKPVLVLVAALLLGGCASQNTAQSANDTAGMLAQQWGVRVLGVRLTADGYMLDFRYRVLDAGKAAPLLDRRIKNAYVMVEKSHAKLAVPVSAKIGAMRQTTDNVRVDRNYFVMFANPGRHVKPGDRVEVVIGDFASGELVVM